MSVDAETNDEFCFDWEIYGDVKYKYRNGSIIDCSFTRVYINDLDLLEASEADKRAAHKVAHQLFATVLKEALEGLYPEIMAKRQTDKLSVSSADKKSRRDAVDGIYLSEPSQDILYDEEEVQMKEMGVPVAFGRRQKRLPASFFDVDVDDVIDAKESVAEREDSAVDVDFASAAQSSAYLDAPVQTKVDVISGTEPCEELNEEQTAIADNIAEEEDAKEDRWQSYWSMNGWYIVWSTWLKQWGEQMDEDTRESTEMSLAGFDTNSLHPSHRRLTEDGVSSDSGCESEHQSWDDLFTEHSLLVEKTCRELFDSRDNRDSRTKKKGARMRRLRQKLTQAGFAVSSGDRKLVNYEDMEMFVDATWDIRPKLPEDDELILFSRHKAKKETKVAHVEPPAIVEDPVDRVDDDSVDFSFDPVRDARLVAKDALKHHGNDPEFIKYWYQRFRLFTKLNKGVLMDGEGWFSVTPERIAEHIAERICRKFGGIVVDAFAGVGGNSIQFALRGAHVIAVDLDPIKLRCAKRNAEVYGVADRISFICSDFFHVAPTLKADAIFLSPPWGGPSYLETDVFDLTEDLKPDGYKIFAAAQKISPNIAFFVPRNTSVQQLMSLAGPSARVEIEQSLLNLKLKTITAYYGDLIHDH